MELDLLGLGMPPATAVGHGGSAMQRPDFERTAFDEPLRLVPASRENPSPVHARVRRRLVDTNDDVPAPPACKVKPSSMSPSPKVCVPGAAGDKSPRASQLGSFRGIFPTTPIFKGSAASSSSNPRRHSTAPLTIFYAGSVRAFDSVPMEQAEKILFTIAKRGSSCRNPVLQQPVPQSEPAAAPSNSAAQMMMLLGLAKANVKDSLLLKRTASLARFLHKRTQRVDSAATMLYRRGEELRTQMDPSAVVYIRDKALLFGDMEQPWASEDVPKNLKENHGEAVNTELKI